MKKTLLYLLVGTVAVVLFASCGMVPLDLNGNWVITGGSVESDIDSTDWQWEGDFKSGSLNIQNESATFSATVEGTLNDSSSNDFDWELDISGNGFCSVNSKDKVLSIFWSSYTEDHVFVDGLGDSDAEETSDYEEESRAYHYSINGSTMTLTRTYTLDFESDVRSDYVNEITERITLQRQ
jgi:hypothetical protein